ncbi:transport system permease protein [Methanococcus aeolicus Nankai-3]|uniref:Transport system permease protein n=1 Tax=Methanococcus aeolicus (strain ATCC BAA-1280 / DSM 17508 / OCM 812 / Nankai-3) TaxID=419665 RepID=A6UT84_META3|nr:iron ABC transporter permease [Methanococcus aeolicus]ABR55706.1 transport system permease protein [Methanococcus aeolicus Nankai-3]
MHFKRFSVLIGVLTTLLIATSIYSMALGTVDIKNSEIINYLYDGTTGNTIKDKIITNLRMPRTLGAVVAGVGIALAGILMQGYFRNPLADPYLMGIASGASLGVVLYIFTSVLVKHGFPHSIYGFILSAYLGSFITMFVVINIARIVKQTSTLLICGLMIGAIASGLTTAIIYLGEYIGEEEDQLSGFLLWGMGSVNNLTWEQIILMAIVVIPVSIICYVFLSKKLDANLLGENYAISVGVNIKNLRTWLIILSCILTATIVAFTGPIAFVGLTCPIIARMICKTSKHLYVMPITALLGGIFLIVADIITRPGVIIPTTSNNLPLLCPLSLIGAPIAIVIYLKIKKMGI